MATSSIPKPNKKQINNISMRQHSKSFKQNKSTELGDLVVINGETYVNLKSLLPFAECSRGGTEEKKPRKSNSKPSKTLLVSDKDILQKSDKSKSIKLQTSKDEKKRVNDPSSLYDIDIPKIRRANKSSSKLNNDAPLRTAKKKMLNPQTNKDSNTSLVPKSKTIPKSENGAVLKNKKQPKRDKINESKNDLINNAALSKSSQRVSRKSVPSKTTSIKKIDNIPLKTEKVKVHESKVDTKLNKSNDPLPTCDINDLHYRSQTTCFLQGAGNTSHTTSDKKGRKSGSNNSMKSFLDPAKKIKMMPDHYSGEPSNHNNLASEDFFTDVAQYINGDIVIKKENITPEKKKVDSGQANKGSIMKKEDTKYEDYQRFPSPCRTPEKYEDDEFSCSCSECDENRCSCSECDEKTCSCSECLSSGCELLGFTSNDSSCSCSSCEGTQTPQSADD